MIGFTAEERGAKELAKVLGGSRKKIKRQLIIAVNATSRKTKGTIAKQIATELATAQKNIKKTSTIRKKAGKADRIPTAIITQKQTSRIPLRDFRARQTKAGVTYKVSKKKGRKVAPGAFQGPTPKRMKASWRGRVFKRVGQSRLPIVQLMGPSPWGVFQKQKLKRPTVKVSRIELANQIRKRIRYLRLKQAGEI